MSLLALLRGLWQQITGSFSPAETTGVPGPACLKQGQLQGRVSEPPVPWLQERGLVPAHPPTPTCYPTTLLSAGPEEPWLWGNRTAPGLPAGLPRSQACLGKALPKQPCAAPQLVHAPGLSAAGEADPMRY